jgi:predicted DNA-binding transcriptional regulator AlpA
MTLDLIGTREISDRYGVSRGQVLRLLNAGDFPEPVAELHLGRVWNADEVKETIKALRKAGRVTSDGRVVPWKFTKAGARD